MQICKRETEKARTRCRDMAEKARRLRFHPTGRTKRMRHSAQTALPACLTGSSGMRQRLFHGTKEALWQDGKARLATLKRRWRKAKDCKRLNDKQIAETPENGAFAAEERRMSGRRIYMEKRLYGCSHRIVSLSRRCNHGAIAVFISYGLPFIRLPTSIRHPVTRLLLMRYAAPQANAETMPDGSGTR
ncbi:unknown [Prevotella sp. CAG:487]|nr:unknown [Prevotella sp. CAG:487]